MVFSLRKVTMNRPARTVMSRMVSSMVNDLNVPLKSSTASALFMDSRLMSAKYVENQCTAIGLMTRLTPIPTIIRLSMVLTVFPLLKQSAPSRNTIIIVITSSIPLKGLI